LAPLVSAVLPVLPGPSVCLVERALRGPQGLLGRKEDRERKAPRDLLVETVSRARLVCPAPPAPRDPQERMETRERLESLDRREAKQTRESRVLLDQLVSKVPSALQVLREAMVSRAPEASRGCLGRRETKEREVSLDHLDPSACRVFLDLQARRERTETSVRWVPLVRPAPEAPRVLAELMVHKGRPAEWEPWEEWVRRGRMARLETLDHLESLELEVLKASEERRARQGRLDQQDPPEPRAPRETTGPRETLVQLVSQEIRVPLVSPVLLVLMVEPERKERTVKLASLAPLVHREKPAHLDPLAREALRERPEQRADKERRAPRVRLELRGLPVKRGPSDPRARPESLVQKVSVESPGLSANKDFLVLLDKMDHLDPWVLPVSLV